MIAVGPSQGDRPLGGSERSSLRGDPVAAGPSTRLPGRPKGALPPGGKPAKRASGGRSSGLPGRPKGALPPGGKPAKRASGGRSSGLPGRPKGALPPGGKAAKRASGGGSTGDRSPGGSERSSFRGDPSRAVLQSRVRDNGSATVAGKGSR
jgi:hypothetical protein